MGFFQDSMCRQEAQGEFCAKWLRHEMSRWISIYVWGLSTTLCAQNLRTYPLLCYKCFLPGLGQRQTTSFLATKITSLSLQLFQKWCPVSSGASLPLGPIYDQRNYPFIRSSIDFLMLIWNSGFQKDCPNLKTFTDEKQLYENKEKRNIQLNAMGQKLDVVYLNSLSHEGPL